MVFFIFKELIICCELKNKLSSDSLTNLGLAVVPEVGRSIKFCLFKL